MTNFTVFTRTFWKKNDNWPGGREPHLGRKTVIGHATSREKAVEMCEDYNNTHSPGFLSRKAEFTSA